MKRWVAILSLCLAAGCGERETVTEPDVATTPVTTPMLAPVSTETVVVDDQATTGYKRTPEAQRTDYEQLRQEAYIEYAGTELNRFHEWTGKLKSALLKKGSMKPGDVDRLIEEMGARENEARTALNELKTAAPAQRDERIKIMTEKMKNLEKIYEEHNAELEE